MTHMRVGLRDGAIRGQIFHLSLAGVLMLFTAKTLRGMRENMQKNGCEALFGPEEGRRVRRLIEAATNEPCPCSQGHPCPLMQLAPANLDWRQAG